ncbi:MAG: dinuclear metal center YbgI/SA1388 family protein [Cyclobacteriaceae bacterium]|jgi:dinuclear metal center YbgI/SA1388 family protein
MEINKITKILEALAPPAYQESYDNSGLLVGNPNTIVTGVLITLDVTEEVIDEAIRNKTNLIVAHHPIIFKGIKSITGKHWVERCIIKAIKNDIAIYAIHTNLDNVINGVNAKIAEKLGLVNTRILSPKSEILTKLVTFIPQENSQDVVQCLYDSGAGEIGEYDHCSFQVDGAGTFRPGPESNPHLGAKGENETVNEKRVEVIFPSFKTDKIISALKKSHPYEEIAYYLTSLQNKNQQVGSGMIGELKKPMETEAFLTFLKDKMQTDVIRHTQIHLKEIRTVAVCGGAGSFLLSHAKAAKADVFISGDFKYHDFFEADNEIIIADIGHYESEQFTKDLLYDILSKKLTNIALLLSGVKTNPIKYL